MLIIFKLKMKEILKFDVQLSLMQMMIIDYVFFKNQIDAFQVQFPGGITFPTLFSLLLFITTTSNLIKN